jgi:hypothetical protein
MTNRTKKTTKKGVSFEPKTDEEALALLRWIYGPEVPAFSGSK